jgi:hypothetical protein
VLRGGTEGTGLESKTRRSLIDTTKRRQGCRMVVPGMAQNCLISLIYLILVLCVPEIFLGVTGGQRVGLTTPPPCEPTLENAGASTSHNPIGLHGLLQG